MAVVHDDTLQQSAKEDGKEEAQFELYENDAAGVSTQDPVYDQDEVEPQLHARTWIALGAFFMLNYVQIIALQSPSAVLSYIGADLHDTKSQSWALVVLSLVQGVLGPIISTASDTFQARKLLLVVSCIISFIGACIAPGSETIYRFIGAHILIGVGFASVPLAYAVPSEILPRRWRPLALTGVNVAAVSASISGPFTISALIKRDAHEGWRQFFWFQAALWGATTIALIVGYRPPKRYSGVENLSVWQKIGHIDLIGCALLTIGMSLFITGTGLGSTLYTWTDARTLSTLIIGIVGLIAFGVYEWKGTKTGIVNHELFRGGRNQGRTFAICVGLLFCEAIIAFSYGVYFPVLVQVLFTNDPVMIILRTMASTIPSVIAGIAWGALSTHFRTIRWTLLAGFIFFEGGLIGLTTLQPDQSGNSIAFSVLFGIGLSAPIILVITGVQLSTPQRLIATATACTTSARAIAGSMFLAINGAAFNTRLEDTLPSYVGKAAGLAGLPAASIPSFIEALSAGDETALSEVSGITPSIIAAGAQALKQAFADSARVVFIIAVPFGAIAVVACWFLGDVSKTMNYHVDAPVEKLEPREHHHHHENPA